jgi:hypothetical protein
MAFEPPAERGTFRDTDHPVLKRDKMRAADCGDG